MKKMIGIFVAMGILLTSCAAPQSAEQNVISSTPDTVGTASRLAAVMPEGAAESALPDAIFDTYYLDTKEPVHAYLQNRGIKKFFDMWLDVYVGEDIAADWNYDTLAPVQLLDHSFGSIARADAELYTCTFSTDDGRYGYIIVSYGIGADGPYISKRSLHETTPYQYDLRANSKQIAAALNKTDIDLSTASAARVEWIDTDKNRGDRIILFSDGKGDKYVGYLGGVDFTVEKQ